MNDINIDFIGHGQARGEMAGLLANQSRLDPNVMRPYVGRDGRSYITVFAGGDAKNPKNYKSRPIQTNATLRKDEWKQLDEAILPIAESRLTGVQDLVGRGLTFDLGNGMGTTVLEHHTVSDAMEADLTMDGITRGSGDRPNYETVYLPIPIIHVDYEINLRALEASRKLGNPLDTTSAERATRKVAEKLENMLFTSTSYAFGGGTVYSFVNYPHRNTVSLSANWDDSSTSGSTVLDDVLAMKQASIDAYHYGPWVLFIPTNYETAIDDDYDSTTPGTTIRERILKVGGIQDVKTVDTLADNNVLLVQTTNDVVRIVRGMGIQNVEWKNEGGMITKYKVMTIQVPQIRSDQDNNCGIVHMS